MHAERRSSRCPWRGAATFGVLAVAASLAAVVNVAAHDPIKTRVTWTGDIARIVAARCVTCHHPGARDTMSLATYEEARPWARAIKEEVITRRMPVWHVVRGYGDFSNDPSLSAFDIALVSAWVDGGAPKGTPADVLKRAGSMNPWTPEAVKFPAGAREVTVACGEGQAPVGTLLAIRPELAKGTSVGVAMKRPDGHVDIIGWIREYDPRFPWTYQLRVPMTVAPQTVISAQPSGPGCSVTLTVLTP